MVAVGSQLGRPEISWGFNQRHEKNMEELMKIEVLMRKMDVLLEKENEPGIWRIWRGSNKWD